MFQFSSNLSTRLDTFHEAKEDDGPGQEKSQRKVVLEASDVTWKPKLNILLLKTKIFC